MQSKPSAQEHGAVARVPGAGAGRSRRRAVVVLFWASGIPRGERPRERGNAQRGHGFAELCETAAAARPQPAGDESATDNQHSELTLPRMEGGY